MSSSPSSSRFPFTSPPPGPPPSPQLVELAHQLHLVHHDAADHGPVLVSVTSGPDPASDADPKGTLGLWDLPPGPGHPLDPLIGFRAPASWDAIGMVVSATTRAVPGVDPGPDARLPPDTRVVSVSLLATDGSSVAFVGPAMDPGPALEEPAVGVAADIMRRMLGLATPPPEETTAAFVDATWLERVSHLIRPRRNQRLTWCWLADHHPLRGQGGVPTPEVLAQRTVDYGRERPWTSFLPRGSNLAPPASRWRPPAGDVVDLATWFDAGSLSRWILRRLPPVEATAALLAEALPPSSARALSIALVTASDGPPGPEEPTSR